MLFNKRFYSTWSFANPWSVRFFEGDDNGAVSVLLADIKSQKSENGTNVFTDRQIENLNVWGSDDPSKAKFRTKDGRLDVTKLTKSYLELQERFAKATSPLPEGATEAERFEHRKQLQKLANVPAGPDEYEIIYPTKLPDDITVNKDDEIALKIACHKHNVSRDGLQAISDLMLKNKLRDLELYTKAVDEQNGNVEKRLLADMGPDDFAENGKLQRRMLRKYFEGSDEEFEKTFNDIRSTLFRGGERSKFLLNKVLSEAARIMEGSGSYIYEQHKEQMTELEQAKKDNPKSYRYLQG